MMIILCHWDFNEQTEKLVRLLLYTVNDTNSQQVNDNLLHVKIFVNIATWHNIVVCSFAIVNSGAIFFFSLYMYVPIGTHFQAHQYHLC